LAAVLEEAWDDDIGAMTEHLGGGMLAAVVSPFWPVPMTARLAGAGMASF
jgi:hypothetical protein